MFDAWYQFQHHFSYIRTVIGYKVDNSENIRQNHKKILKNGLKLQSFRPFSMIFFDQCR